MSEENSEILHIQIFFCDQLHISKTFVLKGFQIVGTIRQYKTILIAAAASHFVAYNNITQGNVIDRFPGVGINQFFPVSNYDFIVAAAGDRHGEGSGQFCTKIEKISIGKFFDLSWLSFFNCYIVTWLWNENVVVFIAYNGCFPVGIIITGRFPAGKLFAVINDFIKLCIIAYDSVVAIFFQGSAFPSVVQKLYAIGPQLGNHPLPVVPAGICPVNKALIIYMNSNSIYTFPEMIRDIHLVVIVAEGIGAGRSLGDIGPVYIKSVMVIC